MDIYRAFHHALTDAVPLAALGCRAYPHLSEASRDAAFLHLRASGLRYHGAGRCLL
jgi:hypothetical protein